MTMPFLQNIPRLSSSPAKAAWGNLSGLRDGGMAG
jgi:hypothetical protein